MHVALCILASAQNCVNHFASVGMHGSLCKFDAIDLVRNIRPHGAVGCVIILVVVVVVVIVVVISNDDCIIESAASASVGESSHSATHPAPSDQLAHSGLK